MTDEKKKADAIEAALNKIHEDITYTAPEGHGSHLLRKIEGRLEKMADFLLDSDDDESHEESYVNTSTVSHVMGDTASDKPASEAVRRIEELSFSTADCVKTSLAIDLVGRLSNGELSLGEAEGLLRASASNLDDNRRAEVNAVMTALNNLTGMLITLLPVAEQCTGCNAIDEDLSGHVCPVADAEVRNIYGRDDRRTAENADNDWLFHQLAREIKGVQMPAPLKAEDLKVEELIGGTIRITHIPTGIISHGSGGSLIQRKMAAVRALEGRVQVHYEHEAHLNWVCPRCRSKHSRGHLPGSPGTYRCLRCGYVGGKDRNPPMMTIPDLEGELTRLNRWGDGGPVFVIDEQLPPGSYLIADLYTDNHVYRIRALTRGSPEKSKLECVAQCRKMRLGEDWTRGNDLSNGRLDWNTWFSILRDIVGYELVSGRPQ